VLVGLIAETDEATEIGRLLTTECCQAGWLTLTTLKRAVLLLHRTRTYRW